MADGDIKNRIRTIPGFFLLVLILGSAFIVSHLLNNPGTLEDRLGKAENDNHNLKSRLLRQKIEHQRDMLKRLENHVKMLPIKLTRIDQLKTEIEEIVKQKNLSPKRMAELDKEATEKSDVSRSTYSIQAAGNKTGSSSESSRTQYLQSLKIENQALYFELLQEYLNPFLRKRLQKELTTLEKERSRIRNLIPKPNIEPGQSVRYYEVLLELLNKEPYFEKKILEKDMGDEE